MSLAGPGWLAEVGGSKVSASQERICWFIVTTPSQTMKSPGANSMGIFSNILSKIFPSGHPANAGAAAATSPASPTAPAAPGAAASPAAPPVDVDAVLSALQAKSTERLNWKTSIVDLLKLLGLDSSLAARKELAAELHYSGSTDDSAAMNMWLHKEVMKKLAENGGKLPADLTA
jgi:hypothetical protein